MAITELPPLSLYVHIPWCVRKCPYCDFNSHKAGKELPEADYVAALKADLAEDVELAQGRKIASIFIGGGTPSLFSAAAIGSILDDAEQRLGFAGDIEITLEANPGTFEQEKFSGYRRAGVNRLSIGIQSFQQQQLERLGRIHTSDEALRAVELARRAGFDNLNLDLMHGLPQQNLSDAMADLEQAITLAPEHLSWYQLTIEPNTAFYNRPPQLPIDDTLADIQEQGQARLAQAGFKQYEVSAYSRPNRQSQHNRHYWRFDDYLGIGAGAHGKITQLAQQQILRRHKTRQPDHYLAAEQSADKAFSAGSQAITPDNLPLEFLMNGLRLTHGVEPELFQQRTGLELTALTEQWQDLQRRGLVTAIDQRLQTTALGQRFLNDVLGPFITD